MPSLEDVIDEEEALNCLSGVCKWLSGEAWTFLALFCGLKKTNLSYLDTMIRLPFGRKEEKPTIQRIPSLTANMVEAA